MSKANKVSASLTPVFSLVLVVLHLCIGSTTSNSTPPIAIFLPWGNLEIKDLDISDEVLEEEKEVLEDLIISAINEAISKAQSKSQEKMNSVTGGMLSGLNIPGM